MEVVLVLEEKVKTLIVMVKNAKEQLCCLTIKV